MRTLEHRRHSERDAGGIHLNAAGVALARRVAGTLSRFDRVVASPKPRALETAELIGGRVDASLPALAEMPEDGWLLAGGGPPASFGDCAALLRRSSAAREYARSQLDVWRAELERVPPGGRLLLVSHGGVIELGAAAALPEAAAGWGKPVGYLEGVRLGWDGRRWRDGEVLRVDR